MAKVKLKTNPDYHKPLMLDDMTPNTPTEPLVGDDISSTKPQIKDDWSPDITDIITQMNHPTTNFVRLSERLQSKSFPKGQRKKRFKKIESARRMNARDIRTKAELMRVAEELLRRGKMQEDEIMEVCDLNYNDMRMITEDLQNLRNLASDTTTFLSKNVTGSDKIEIKYLKDLKFDSGGSIFKSDLNNSHNRDLSDPLIPRLLSPSTRTISGKSDKSWASIKTSRSRISTAYNLKERPLLYEYAIVLKVGDETETEFFNTHGERLDSFSHYANKTYQLLSQLLREWIDEDNIVDVDVKNNDPLYNIGAGFCVEMYRSQPVYSNGRWVSKYIIGLIGLKEEDLKSWANLQQTDLLINARYGIQKGREQGFPLAIKTVLPGEEQDALKKINFRMWNYCYVQYTSIPSRQCIYQHYPINPDSNSKPLQESVFPKKVRLRLIWEKLIAEAEIGGADIPVEKLLQDSNHPLVAVFPLHTYCHRKWLDENWLQKYNWKSLLHPPLDDIRDYFNEPIAFYFGFMEYYLKWLIPLSIVGAAWSVIMLNLTDSTFGGIEVFVVFVLIWNVCFVDFWKRRQNQLTMQWGMHRFREKEIPRPSFRGQWDVDDTTGEPIESFPREWRLVRLIGGFSGLFMMISVVIAVMILIFTLRNFLRIREGVPKCYPSSEKYPDCTMYQCVDGQNLDDCSEHGGVVKQLQLGWLVFIGVVNAGQISILNVVFTYVSVWLNEWENHKTQVAFDDALVLKAFTFKFVNSFCSLYYLAFLAKIYDSASHLSSTDIIKLLRVQLISLFSVALIIQNFRELALPLIIKFFQGDGSCCRKKKRGGRLRIPKSPAEVQFEMVEYRNTLEDMSEVIVQYGYVTLFIICLPCIPLFAFLNNIVEIKIDGYKLVRYSRRPQPFGAKGIGSWVFVLECISIISAVTNVALYVFLLDEIEVFLEDDEGLAMEQKKIRVFLILCLALCTIVVIFKLLIKDMPASVARHLRRQEYIEDILVKGQVYNEDKLRKLCWIEQEIRDREEELYCCGNFRATSRCCCIPWFTLSDRQLLEAWINPVMKNGRTPCEKVEPLFVIDYGEVLQNYNQDRDILPMGPKSRVSSLRPHRKTMAGADMYSQRESMSSGEESLTHRDSFKM